MPELFGSDIEWIIYIGFENELTLAHYQCGLVWLRDKDSMALVHRLAEIGEEPGGVSCYLLQTSSAQATSSLFQVRPTDLREDSED